MSAAVHEVASICRDADSAWHATCALLERAESLGGGGGDWADGDSQPEAERVRETLERALNRPGDVPLNVGTADDASDAGDAVAMMTTSLTTGELSYLVASVLDQQFWRSFTRGWLADRGPVFDLHAGDRYPVDDMRLMGAVGYSARPSRRGLGAGELAHVRQLKSDGIRVEVNGEYPRIIDLLAAATPLEAAVLLPNESWAELTEAPGRMGPADSVMQQAIVTELLRHASELGVSVAVLPELSVDEDIVESLATDWAEATDRPILFAGSAHLADVNRRVNRTTVLLPGVGPAWHHDKTTVFENRDGKREPIDPGEPSITLGCGYQVRIATLICKDALGTDMYRLVADLGVHLLAVPAMSDRLGDFSAVAHELVARSQGATVVANNPRLWRGADVEHALLGQPVRETGARVTDRRSAGAPDIAIARLGSGWVS